MEAPVLFGFGGVAAVGPTGAVDLGGPKQRAVLALLMLEPGAVVPLDRIIARVWSDSPPPRPEVSVRGYISHLRKALATAGLGSDTIDFRDRGYVLLVAPELIDLHLFGRLVDEARRRAADGDLVAARALLVRAVDLSLGPPFGSIAEDLALVEATALYEERRGEAVEALMEVRLALGEHAQLPAALAPEIARQPYRERLRAQLAVALYRAGRPVEALRSIDDTRRLLRDDIGVDPGPELRQLEAAILDHDDDTLGWQPQPVAAPAARVDAAPGEARFGRADELARIAAALDVLDRRGGVVVISGEAGIGKSTVLAGLRAEASRRGLVVAWDRCPEAAGGAPYRSWRTVMATLAPNDPIVVDAAEGGQELAGARLATQLGVLDRLRARDEPAVVVIDDLQWADDATLALLAFLAPDLERLRILVGVGVRRSGAADIGAGARDCLVELGRTNDPLHLTLPGLAPDAVADWVSARAGGTPDPDLVDYVADLTAGNPFYVRELLALLEAEGRLAGEFQGGPTLVPHAVQDVVRRRTSRLPPDTQAVLTAAAVIGRRFDLDLLAGVLELGVAEALDRLEPALDDGLVEADDRTPGRFAFSHALVSATLVAELNASRLASWHARITTVLEALRRHDVEPWVEDLAHHAAQGLMAGSAPQAYTYALRAAERSEAAQSSAEAAVQLQRALDAAAVLPDVSNADRVELLRRLGVALRDSGDPRGRSALVDAARLADADGDVHSAAEILGALDVESLWAGYDWGLHDPRVASIVERALARPGLTERDRTLLTMALAGELTYVDNLRSNELFAAARAGADATGDTLLSARVLLQWMWSVSGPDGVTARGFIGDRLIALDGDGELPTRLRPLAHLARVSSALELGDAALARRCVAAARRLAHPVRTPTGWAHLQFAEAGLALNDGDLEHARGHATALRPASSASAGTRPTPARPASSPWSRPRPGTRTPRSRGCNPCSTRRTRARSAGRKPGSWPRAAALRRRGRRSTRSTGRFPTTGCCCRS